MEDLINALKLENITYELGFIKDGYFHHLSANNSNINTIKIKAKENYISKLVAKLKTHNITLDNKQEDCFYTEYTLSNTNIRLLIEHVVNSHILVPAVLLKDFMDDDKKLYYIDGKTEKISSGSVKKYNTQIGYYSKFFEIYLSINYENKIGEIKSQLNKFVFDKPDNIELNNLYNDIELLFKMSLFRNPEFVEQVNAESLSSILIKGGYSSEFIAFLFEKQDLGLFKDNKLFIIKNTTEEGLILSNNIFSSINISKGYESAILPLHPKYGITIVPNELYEKKIKEYGPNSYMIIDNINELRKINKWIALGSLNKKSNVIGKKSDLSNFLDNK